MDDRPAKLSRLRDQLAADIYSDLTRAGFVLSMDAAYGIAGDVIDQAVAINPDHRPSTETSPPPEPRGATFAEHIIAIEHSE